MGEIEGLVQQARTEAGRHEQKRSQAAEKLKPEAKGSTSESESQVDQLLALTKRSAIMESQIDILEGKLKILTRFRESLRRYSAELDRASMGGRCPSTRRASWTRARRSHRQSRASSWRPKKTCAERSRGRCTTARPRA